jgi:hypothetical protein
LVNARSIEINRLIRERREETMSAKVGIDLIDFQRLTLEQKSALKKKLRSRVQALQAHLDEVNAALKVIEDTTKQRRRKNRTRRK